MPDPKETIILRWSMDDESWSHWAQGRGKQTVRAVVLEMLSEIRRSQAAREGVKQRCEAIRRQQESPPPEEKVASRENKIEIRLPASDWGEACQQIGRLEGGDPVRPNQLITAMIRESKSWKQIGDDDGEFNSGYSEPPLISSIALSTELTHTSGISLEKEEKIIAWIVAMASVASALAAWLWPMSA